MSVIEFGPFYKAPENWHGPDDGQPPHPFDYSVTRDEICEVCLEPLLPGEQLEWHQYGTTSTGARQLCQHVGHRECYKYLQNCPSCGVIWNRPAEAQAEVYANGWERYEDLENERIAANVRLLTGVFPEGSDQARAQRALRTQLEHPTLLNSEFTNPEHLYARKQAALRAQLNLQPPARYEYTDDQYQDAVIEKEKYNEYAQNHGLPRIFAPEPDPALPAFIDWSKNDIYLCIRTDPSLQHFKRVARRTWEYEGVGVLNNGMDPLAAYLYIAREPTLEFAQEIYKWFPADTGIKTNNAAQVLVARIIASGGPRYLDILKWLTSREILPYSFATPFIPDDLKRDILVFQ